MTNKKVPQRKCVGCAQIKDKKELIRIIKSTDGEISIDSSGRKNGRGAYICADPKCLEKAQKSKGLERSLKVAIPKEVYDELLKEMSSIDR